MHKKRRLSGNGKTPKRRGFDVVPPEVWRQHQGKCIIYSEEEGRVIGVGDSWQDAEAQAEASGIQGLWHYHRAARWGEENL
jgi:hypothetical protein